MATAEWRLKPIGWEGRLEARNVPVLSAMVAKVEGNVTPQTRSSVTSCLRSLVAQPQILGVGWDIF